MKFTEDHEWLRPEGDLVIVGITAHASEQLGDVVFVDLPEPGATVGKGEGICVIESVKAASDILAPLDGEIIEINEDLNGNPGLVNGDPTGKAWVFKMRPADMAALEDFMDEAAYQALIGQDDVSPHDL